MADRESTVEDHLVAECKRHGILTRKVAWIGRSKAMDRLLVHAGRVVFVEMKSPEKFATFPANAHERAQLREMNRFGAQGVAVRLVGTKEGVDALVREMAA